MERTDELKERIRQQPLNDRLEESRRRIGDMCSKGRCPKMTIPVQHDDDDFYINTTLADAQATIAALQARVQELEAIKIPDDAFTYCAYCGEKSPVDEHNEDLAAHIKVCPKHPMRDVEAQLTQCTAELEAANKLLYKKNCALGKAEMVTDDLQSQLAERTRELSQVSSDLQAAWRVEHTLRDDLTTLRALVEAWAQAHESVDDWFKRAATDENTPTIAEFDAVKAALFEAERALKHALEPSGGEA